MTTPKLNQINPIDNDGNPLEPGAVIQTGENQPNWTSGAVFNPFSSVVESRLTLSSTESVPSSDITGATTLRLLPHIGQVVSLYDSTTATWLPRILPESGISFDLSTDLEFDGAALAINTNYDVYAWWNGTDIQLELVAWTTSTLGTARPTMANREPDFFEGVYVLENNEEYRYLGTIRTNSGGVTCEQSAQRLFVWNFYNQVPQTMKYSDSTNWNDFNSSTIRPFGTTISAIAEFQMEFVLGFQAPVRAEAYSTAQKTSGAGNVSWDILMGLDSISVNSSDVSTSGSVTTAVLNEDHSMHIYFNSAVGNGYHYVNPLWFVFGSGGPLNVNFNTNDDAALVTRING